jgi:hypothetical protein
MSDSLHRESEEPKRTPTDDAGDTDAKICETNPFASRAGSRFGVEPPVSGFGLPSLEFRYQRHPALSAVHPKFTKPLRSARRF